MLWHNPGMTAIQSRTAGTSGHKGTRPQMTDNGFNVTKEIYNPLEQFKLALVYALALGVQADVAKAINRNQTQVSRWANNQTSPLRRDLPRLTRSLRAFINRRSKKTASC